MRVDTGVGGIVRRPKASREALAHFLEQILFLILRHNSGIIFSTPKST